MTPMENCRWVVSFMEFAPDCLFCRFTICSSVFGRGGRSHDDDDLIGSSLAPVPLDPNSVMAAPTPAASPARPHRPEIFHGGFMRHLEEETRIGRAGVERRGHRASGGAVRGPGKGGGGRPRRGGIGGEGVPCKGISWGGEGVVGGGRCLSNSGGIGIKRGKGEGGCGC